MAHFRLKSILCTDEGPYAPEKGLLLERPATPRTINKEATRLVKCPLLGAKSGGASSRRNVSGLLPEAVDAAAHCGQKRYQ